LPFDPSRASSFDVGSIQYLDVAVGEKLLLRSNSKADDLRNGGDRRGEGLRARQITASQR